MAPLPDAAGDWAAFLAMAPRVDEMGALRRHERIGRPLGDGGFIATLEEAPGRDLRSGRPGLRRNRAEERSIA